jgi:tetratricopeptide (TPR) repeat protein
MNRIIVLLVLLAVIFTGNSYLTFAQDLSDSSYESDIEYIITKYILGDYEEAVRLLNKYHSDNQDGLSYLFGLCYLKISMNKIAIDYFNITLTEHDNNYEVLNNIGVAYFQDSDYLSAMRYFHLSFISNPDYEVAQRNYNAAYNSWNYQNEKGAFVSIIPLIQFSERSTMYNSLGWFYYYSGDFHNAIYYFEKSIDEDAKYQFSYIALAYIYYEGNNFETALYYLKEAEKINKINPDLYNNMGIICFHLSDFDNSEKAFKRAITLNKKFAEPYNNLGFLYFETGKYGLSEEYFGKSIEINVDNQSLKAESMAGIALLNFINKNIEKSKTYKESSAKLDYKMNDIRHITDKLKWTNKMIEVWNNIGLVQ